MINIKYYLTHPIVVLSRFAAKGFIYMPDKLFLKIVYAEKTGLKLNLEKPQRYNEKLQWMKLYDRNPLYTDLVDKYVVKQRIKDMIGEEYIIPTLGVWNKFEDIDFESLPEQFVLKCTHDSGGLVICKSKKELDLKKASKKISKSLKRDYYLLGREWPYKNVKRKIIAEQYMEDYETGELRDYKFFCFNGVVKALYVASERYKEGSDVKFDFFSPRYEHLPFTRGHKNADVTPQKPQHLEKMIELAEIISSNLRAARIDFYECNGRIYFGEITFFPDGGFFRFEPDEWDYNFGKWLELPFEEKNK